MMTWRERLRMPHYVYRCYDSAGRLIYVGMAHDVERRMYQHRRDWQHGPSRLLRRYLAAYSVAGPYPDLFTAERAEQLVIETESPVFNKQHRGLARREVDAEIAEYEAAVAS